MKKVLSIIVILFLGLGLFASSSAGTAASPFLEICVGAKPSSLGDAFIGLADDFNAMLFNPSGLGFMEKGSISFSHMNWFADISIMSASILYPLSGFGTIGFTWQSLNYGNMPRTTVTGASDGVVTGNDSLFAFAFGRKFTASLSVGCVFKYVYLNLDGYSAGAPAFDIGILLKTEPAKWPFGVGLSIRNIGGKMKFISESAPLPIFFGGGFSFGVFVSETNNIKALIDFGKSTDSDIKFNIGAEYGFKDFLAIRLGYKLGDYDVEGSSVGLGAGYTMENGTRLQLDYAYETTIEGFKDVHRISFSFEF